MEETVDFSLKNNHCNSNLYKFAPVLYKKEDLSLRYEQGLNPRDKSVRKLKRKAPYY